MKYHELKTDPIVFAAVAAGIKTHEIRFDDRGFAIGDILHLRETRTSGEAMRAGAPLAYTGRHALREISHIQTGYGLVDGWVILSFRQGEPRHGRRKDDAHPTHGLEWAEQPDALHTGYSKITTIPAKITATPAVEDAMMTVDAERLRRLQERGPDRRVAQLAVPVERRSGIDRRAVQGGAA